MSGEAAVARWAKVIDQTRCIGCHACSTACKSENHVPLGVNRTYVKYVDVGAFPHVRRVFQVTRCNQCADAPCTTACPTAAMVARPDGIVDFDKQICIGCKACIAACPYDAIFMNPEDHSAEKCNFCAHRIDRGLEPACVIVCPTQAIIVGDLDDASSKVAAIVGRGPLAVRRPEKETHPKLFYRGADQATLDPLAASRPGGGLFMWSEQGKFAGQVGAGNPGRTNGGAVVAYDVPHRAPWDWRVSLYTWTKGIAAGAYLVPLLLVLGGWLDDSSMLWRLAAPILAGLFLALTGLVLIADLEHPERFYLILIRPQWRSWLARGAFIILGYSVVLGVHFCVALVGAVAPLRWLALAGAPLAAMTAVYTAYLFAQAKGRDLWQSALLPPHFLLQALLAGAAAQAPIAAWLEPLAVPSLLVALGIASLLHGLFSLAEATLGHETAHARLAAQEMVSGTWAPYFRGALAASVAGAAAPWIGVLAAPVALAGLFAHEHATVQAGQSVPLA